MLAALRCAYRYSQLTRQYLTRELVLCSTSKGGYSQRSGKSHPDTQLFSMIGASWQQERESSTGLEKPDYSGHPLLFNEKSASPHLI
jgi:hypothetical protein